MNRRLFLNALGGILLAAPTVSARV